MYDDCLITLTGRKSVYIENYKNILDYKEDCILLQAKKEKIKITGEQFRIEFFTNENMQIKGEIRRIEILE